MTKYCYVYFISIFVFIFTQGLFAVEIPKTISVCGDGAEWPPYIYWERTDQGTKTDRLVGLTVDLLQAALKSRKIQVKFDLPPWKRCLAQVEAGHNFSIALDASYSKERDQKFLMTDYYYEISPKIFYLKSRFPSGFPKFSSAKELLKLGNICGLSGYNYESFMPQLKNSEIDTGTKNFDSVIKKTKAGACIAFLARFEIISGFKRLGKNFGIGEEIQSRHLPNAKKDKFYMLISRKIPYRKELKAALDIEFRRLRNDKTLTKRYFK